MKIVGAFALSLASMLVAGTVLAASPGCDAVNAGAYNGTTSGTNGQLGLERVGPLTFAVGETISLTLTYVAGAGSIPENASASLDAPDQVLRLVGSATGPVTGSYTIPDATRTNMTLSRGAGTGFQSVSATTSATCQAAPAPVPTMSEWAMILLGALLAGLAAVYIQRRRRLA